MNWLWIILIIISILLIILILLQKTNTDGAGLGSDNFVGSNKKRGLEKTIFKFTILIGLVFVILNIIAIFVK